MNILITGGAGYIGSHAVVCLAQAGHHITILDNLCNSNESVINQIAQILGYPVHFVNADVRNTELLKQVLREQKIEAVLHFAGLKSVAQSVADPMLYYSNNDQGSASLIEAMQANAVKTFVFSSSATVYGNPVYMPYDEQHGTNPINPYGNSKLAVEMMLRDWAHSDPEVHASILRYFNPVGAHESGLIGESPRGVPNNLMPYIISVVAGALPQLNIFGNDYETRDGTGERDYIHVMDLAEGHLAALDFLNSHPGAHVHNLGTGKGTTVLELINAFETANSVKIPYQFSPRRDGDLPSYYANANNAFSQLQWNPLRTIEESSKDSYRYFQTMIQ
jgi:UDP-glucose 4-epimerase